MRSGFWGEVDALYRFARRRGWRLITFPLIPFTAWPPIYVDAPRIIGHTPRQAQETIEKWDAKHGRLPEKE